MCVVYTCVAIAFEMATMEHAGVSGVQLVVGAENVRLW